MCRLGTHTCCTCCIIRLSNDVDAFWEVNCEALRLQTHRYKTMWSLAKYKWLKHPVTMACILKWLNAIKCMALAYIKGEDNDVHMYQQTVNCTACNFKCITLTVVSCHLLPTPTAVSTQSNMTHWCNSHFIHCTKIEVGDNIWGCTRARHWASCVRGGSPSPVLHRVTSDHLTRSQRWSAPSDSDLAWFIQCHHWHTSRRRLRYICWREWWSLDKHWALNRIPCCVSPNAISCHHSIPTIAIPQFMQEKLAPIFRYASQLYQ